MNGVIQPLVIARGQQCAAPPNRDEIRFRRRRDFPGEAGGGQLPRHRSLRHKSRQDARSPSAADGGAGAVQAEFVGQYLRQERVLRAG